MLWSLLQILLITHEKFQSQYSASSLCFLKVGAYWVTDSDKVT